MKAHRIFVATIAIAAAMMIAAAAAMAGGGLSQYFNLSTPAKLDEITTQLDGQTEINGWRIVLTDCVGDDNMVYVGVEATPPDGTVIDHEDEYYLNAYLEPSDGSSVPICNGGAAPVQLQVGGNENVLRFACTFDNTGYQSQGRTATFVIKELRHLHKDAGNEQGVYITDLPFQKSPVADPYLIIDVKLNYPTLEVRTLTPNRAVRLKHGTVTLERIDLSPLSVTLTLTGENMQNIRWSEESGEPADPAVYFLDQNKNMIDRPVRPALRVQPISSSRYDEKQPDGGYSVARHTEYFGTVIDLSQIKFVKVFGIDIPMS